MKREEFVGKNLVVTDIGADSMLVGDISIGYPPTKMYKIEAIGDGYPQLVIYELVEKELK